MDKSVTIQELKTIVKEFCDKRDWEQFHNPKDLATGITIESAELQELFLWKNKDELKDILKNKKEDIEDEMSDILFYLLSFANSNNIDISDSLKRKIEKNNIKYPAEKVKGSSKKYTEY
jgi:NTP pyrophosphatase (non-canonical NTP hydrolase)